MERQAYFYFSNTSCFISLIFFNRSTFAYFDIYSDFKPGVSLAGISYQAFLACKLPDLYGDKDLLFTALL